MPLVAGHGPVGAITLADREGGPFGPEDERVLTMLASGAVIALENAQLYRAERARRQEAERRRQVAEGLRDILAVLNSNRPVAQTLDYIVTQAGRVLEADAAVVYRLAWQSQTGPGGGGLWSAAGGGGGGPDPVRL